MQSRLSRSLRIGVVFTLFTAGCSSTSVPPVSQSTTTMSQALWVANGTNVLEFLPSQLTSGASDPAPHLALNSAAGFGAPQGVTFDAFGDLFVIDGGAAGSVAPAIDEFTPAQLAALKKTPNPAPAATIAYSGFVFPQQAVFDASGNLWVSDNGANADYKFAKSGGAFASTPSATLSSNPAFAGPLGIAFASNGNLWIANNASTTIEEFNASALPSSGSVTLAPNVTLSDNGSGTIQGPWALAFDASGNLWSSNANAPNTVVEFAASALGTTGSPAPAITLAATTENGVATLNAPNGIAFDSIGDLAAVDAAPTFAIPVFSPKQLASGGTIAPSVLLSGSATTLNLPAGDTFGPIVK